MTELWLLAFPTARVVKMLGSLEAQCAEPEITGSFLLNQTLWLLFSHSLPEINHVLSDWSHCSQLRELVLGGARGSGLGAPVSKDPGLWAGGEGKEWLVLSLGGCSHWGRDNGARHLLLAGRRDPPVKSQGEQGSVGGIDEKGWSQGDAARRKEGRGRKSAGRGEDPGFPSAR